MMVDTQVRPSDVTRFPIIEAMLHVPRESLVPESRREAAYLGENLFLAPGRVMLEPRTLAKFLEGLDVQPGERVLDLGTGLGYGAGVLARPGAEGAPTLAPFDVILVEGAVETVPEAILAQLTEDGRIGAIFSEENLGIARIGRKEGGAVHWRYAFNAGAPVLPGFARAAAFVL